MSAGMELVAPCHFGLEAVLKREITHLGYTITRVEDGRVTYLADAQGIARSNLFLRTAERVLLQAGTFRAETFDELFEQTKALPWEDFLPAEAKFWVTKASSVSSRLFSPRDIQAIVKKAIVKRLSGIYRREWFPESGAAYPLRVFLRKNEVAICLDTSGDSLHKRGYRKKQSLAPISETLAAALLALTPWKADRILADPFCGCGTFPIEAALMAQNAAPGRNRRFTAEAWQNLVPAVCWQRAREEAEDSLVRQVPTQIFASDSDAAMVKAARENAAAAGVSPLIHFEQADAAHFSPEGAYGFVVTNPPYGERLETKENLYPLYRAFGERCQSLPTWSFYIISAFEGVEGAFGKKAAKKRKIYNGMIRSYFYRFPGEKPGKCQRNLIATLK